MTLNNLSISTIKDRGTLLAHIGASFAVIVWGISFVSTKVLLDAGLHPVEIYIYRFLIAYLLVLAVSHKQFKSHSWRDELLFAVCGVCAGSIYFIAENTALQYTLVSNVSLITTTSPLLTVLLIGLLYKSERPSKGMVMGSVVAFLGVGCVIFNSSFVIKVKPLGDLLALAAAFSFALYSVVLRRLNALYSVMFISRKTFFYGVVSAIPFLVAEPEIAPVTILFKTEVWTNLLLLGVGASMLAFVIWAEIVKRLGPIKASNYLYFQPVVTLIASAWILDEKVTLVGYIGCTMILGGVWLSDFLSRRSIDRSRTSREVE